MSRINIWMMWFLASVFYAYQYILRVSPNIMMPDIMAKYDIEAALFGQFSGLYYLGYAGSHIPIGLMLDRIGPKKVLPVCMLFAVAGLSPFIWTDIWIYPILGRFLIGIGSSGAILGVFKIIQICFPADRFTRMLGISVTIGLLGGIYGGQPVHYLLQTFGWEQVLQIICLVGLAMALAMYLLIPNYQEVNPSTENIWRSIKTVLSHPRAMTICILGGMMVGPMEGFADVWGTEYLKSAYNLDSSVASGLPSFIFLGMCFGAPLLSYLADKFRNYFAVIIASALIMAAGFAAMLLGVFNVFGLTINFVVIGVMCAYQIPVIYMASQSVPKHVQSLTTACANMIIMTFGYVFHSSIGQILNLSWDGTLVDGTPVYSSLAYTTALMVIPSGLMIGALGFYWLSRAQRVEVAQAL